MTDSLERLVAEVPMQEYSAMKYQLRKLEELRNPSDELIERLAKAISVRYHQGNSDARYYTVRVLAALADEFGVTA